MDPAESGKPGRHRVRSRRRLPIAGRLPGFPNLLTFELLLFPFMLPRASDLIRAMHASLVFAAVVTLSGAAEPTTAQWQELMEQNRRLQEHVLTQQETIDALNAKMADVLRASERHEHELRGLQERVEKGFDERIPGAREREVAPSFARGAGEVRIAAEAGFGYFRTGANGQFPQGAFRVDDPVITIEAPVVKNVYFFTELKLLTRETNAEAFELGEIYVDFEDVLGSWDRPGLLNIRAGRLNIPFGEEYLVRSPVVNPLISHSLGDLWGVDEGIEAYGRVGPAHYIIAVQNGGSSRLRDFDSDKSIAARVSWRPESWLHVSGSAMRTGRLSTAGDSLSELWFGNAFFRALGPVAITESFWANLFQADATARWKRGHASVALGQARFDDSDPTADNARRLNYGYVEAAQEIVDGLYAAARYSAITVAGGYPLAGWGPLGAFFFRPGVLTEELRRMSVGLGYRFAPPLVLKIEYTWETGRMTTGARRDHGDFFGTELGVRF